MIKAGLKWLRTLNDIDLIQLKQSLLLFDEIGVIPLDEKINDCTDVNRFQFRTLEEHGYVFNASQFYWQAVPAFARRNMEGLELRKDFKFPKNSYELFSLRSDDDSTRTLSRTLNEYSFLTNKSTVPLVSSTDLKNSESVTSADAISLIIEKLPIPENTISIEQILEFKNDFDNKGRFAGLQVWMTQAIKSGLKVNELNDELDWLLYQYRKSLELHKIKYYTGSLQRVVVGTAELIENAARLKFSNIAKGLFSAHQEKVDLLKAELESPGNEIAYIYQAQKAFGK